MDFKRHVVSRRVMHDLRKRSSIGILFYVIILLVILGNDGYFLRHPDFSFYFVLANTGICLFRTLHLLVSDKIIQINRTLDISIFMGSVVITALIWGIGCAVLMMQSDENEARILMSICAAGLCAGGVSAFMPERHLALAFNACMLFPAFAMLQFTGKNPSMAAVILMYSLYLALMTMKGNNEYWDALENEYMLKRKSEELEKMSNTDVLTNLYNRRYFNEIFEIEWKRASRNRQYLTIIICDIDYFKQINDTFGHLAGDEYLKKIAGVLKKVFKRKSDIVARYGGEEFVALLPDADAETACELAENLRLAAEASRIQYKDEIIAATLSIGVMSCIPDYNENDDRDAIIAKADKALYQAKKKGRNRVCHHFSV
ncbi:MAG: GGDEF domain-containing protein [Desulfococcaceae bacterium]|nr:GGDEF domain-containing protein [Desulfococcaceae bacterium]